MTIATPQSRRSQRTHGNRAMQVPFLAATVCGRTLGSLLYALARPAYP